ncbi:MAG: hypothetical protein WAN14_07370 [Candidatus Acidiferrales bacterium]
METVRDAGEPGQNRKCENRGNEDGAAADAVRERAEEQSGDGPGDGEDRGEHADLFVREMKFGDDVGREVELGHAVEEDRAPGEEEDGD